MGPTSSANIVPFAIVCAGWIVPMLRFWATVILRTPSTAAWVILGFLVCASVWWLPQSYYRIRGFESHGRLYELLGVRLFRMVAPNGDLARRWMLRRDPGFRVIANAADAVRYFEQTIRSERAHLPALLMGIASAVYANALGWNGWGTYLSVATVVVHVYPILLQRYTRSRLLRIQERSIA